MKSVFYQNRLVAHGRKKSGAAMFTGLVAALLAGNVAQAQVAGSTQTTNYYLPFSANENSVELPAPASLDLSRAEFRQGFSQTVGINYNTDAFGSAISGLLGFLGVSTLPPEAVDVIDFAGDLLPI